MRQAFFGSSPIGLRRLLVLVRGLPADAALMGILARQQEASSNGSSEPLPMSSKAEQRAFFGGGAGRVVVTRKREGV